MSKKELVRRYTLFMFSVLVNGFSIAVITKALLGTSPISSVPYVLSLITPLTMGQFTIYMNFLFIMLEMILMGKEETKAKRYELMSQVPITLCFGLFIDLSMYVLWWLEPSYYLSQLFTLLVGCVILATGISLEVKANVAMVTGEYLVQIISKVLRKEFGFIKVCFDVTLVVIAIILSLCFLPSIQGIREGTIIAALIVGPISHFVFPYWRIFDKWLNVTPKEEEISEEGKALPIVITITREYGSGGRLLGQRVAKELGIKFYDGELISMVAEESKLPAKYIEKNEQKVSSNYLLHIIMQDYEAPIERSLSTADAIFVSQSRVIRKLAHEQSCVIIGRCADYILDDYPSTSLIKVFCYTDLEKACQRCVDVYKMEPKDIRNTVIATNKARVNHYIHYTNRKWGDPHDYNLMINTGSIPMETACAFITQLYRSYSSQANKID